MGYNDNKQESAVVKILAYACILLTAVSFNLGGGQFSVVSVSQISI